MQPAASATRALVEYAAHPAATLYLEGRAVALRELAGSPAAVAAADRPVRIRVTERGSAQPVAVRLHLHGAAGEYLPPKGYHRTVNGNWFEDNYGEFVNGYNQYAYIPGQCVADLPLGEVFVEIDFDGATTLGPAHPPARPRHPPRTLTHGRGGAHRTRELQLGERGESRWDSGTTSADCERKMLFRESGSAST